MNPFVNIHTHTHIDNEDLIQITNIDIDNIVNVDVTFFVVLEYILGKIYSLRITVYKLYQLFLRNSKP